MLNRLEFEQIKPSCKITPISFVPQYDWVHHTLTIQLYAIFFHASKISSNLVEKRIPHSWVILVEILSRVVNELKDIEVKLNKVEHLAQSLASV
jgi:hypothetical protein